MSPLRGKVRPTTRTEAIARARSMMSAVLPVPPGSPPGTLAGPLRYRLAAGHNGGTNPFADHPGSPSYGNRTWTADCVGFVAWCCGFDRFQKASFPHYSGWINCDSAIIDAKAHGDWFRMVGAPRVGDLVAYGSTYAGPIRLKAGHIGLIVGAPDDLAWDGDFAKLQVIHCSAGADRKYGRAVTESTGSIWQKKGQVIRYQRFAIEGD